MYTKQGNICVGFGCVPMTSCVDCQLTICLCFFRFGFHIFMYANRDELVSWRVEVVCPIVILYNMHGGLFRGDNTRQSDVMKIAAPIYFHQIVLPKCSLATLSK